MSARWDDAAAGWPPRNAPPVSLWLARDDAEVDEEDEAQSWRRTFVQQDGWPQPVPLLLCAIVSFAVPVSWALFAVESDTAEQRQQAKAAGNSTQDAQAISINPWDQIGTMRSIVIFLACGTWLTCLWFHVARMSVAEERRRRQARAGLHGVVQEEPHKVAHGLEAILNTRAISEPSYEDSPDSNSSDLDAKGWPDRGQKVAKVTWSSSSEDDDVLEPIYAGRGYGNEQGRGVEAGSEDDSLENLAAEIACLELQKQHHEEELALRRSLRENNDMLKVSLITLGTCMFFVFTAPCDFQELRMMERKSRYSGSASYPSSESSHFMSRDAQGAEDASLEEEDVRIDIHNMSSVSSRDESAVSQLLDGGSALVRNVPEHDAGAESAPSSELGLDEDIYQGARHANSFKADSSHKYDEAFTGPQEAKTGGDVDTGDGSEEDGPAQPARRYPMTNVKVEEDVLELEAAKQVSTLLSMIEEMGSGGQHM